MMARALRPAALVGGIFLAVTGSVVANAVFLQQGRHPAPLFDTRPAPARPSPAQPDARVAAIQAALRDAGYYNGRVDGVAGAQTRAAISAYERRLGWVPTGAASRDVLAALRADAAARPASGGTETGPETTAAVLPDSRVAAVQTALARAAYGPLKADGVFGPATRDAIMRFQAHHGLTVTGEISDALIVELRAAGALAE